MRDMRDPSAKTTVLARLGQWIYDHPILAFVVIVFVDIAVIFCIGDLFGCRPQPPARFENGDRTVYVPPDLATEK